MAQSLRAWRATLAIGQFVGMDDAFENAVRFIEVFIFASAEPAAVGALSRLVLMLRSAREVVDRHRRTAAGRGEVELVADTGGWQFRT